MVKIYKDAITKGASIIVCSKKCKFKDRNILVIKKKNIRNFLSKTVSKFYKLKPKILLLLLAQMEKHQ